VCTIYTQLKYLPARSVEDETRNGHRNAKRNPSRNHETIVLGLFPLENLKRAIKLWFLDSIHMTGSDSSVCSSIRQ